VLQTVGWLDICTNGSRHDASKLLSGKSDFSASDCFEVASPSSDNLSRFRKFCCWNVERNKSILLQSKSPVYALGTLYVNQWSVFRWPISVCDSQCFSS